ncbi:PREDICTED: uncharacterized protein LOC105454800 [Wasmannia auropunctata]|uniref:uncharacterized protein LOC105454800 n=1 Tax=Wasmannia auropunctata TaxID=64793 RepID=UPI0005EFE527|nr:PREDICTED: uncharacterized protein LOC105454800 [Wasmannia auropunctata]
MMSSKYLMSKFETSFLFFIVLGVISLSLNIFRFLQILSSNYMSVELSIAFITICSICVYMFLANLAGQTITDHYDLLFDTAYKVEWYTTPLYIQKFILLLLLRGNKSFSLRVGKLFIASLPCFTTLANASLSYFIVIYSTQE